jgi:hypothetical protein
VGGGQLSLVLKQVVNAVTITLTEEIYCCINETAGWTGEGRATRRHILCSSASSLCLCPLQSAWKLVFRANQSSLCKQRWHYDTALRDQGCRQTQRMVWSKGGSMISRGKPMNLEGIPAAVPLPPPQISHKFTQELTPSPRCLQYSGIARSILYRMAWWVWNKYKGIGRGMNEMQSQNLSGKKVKLSL